MHTVTLIMPVLVGGALMAFHVVAMMHTLRQLEQLAEADEETLQSWLASLKVRYDRETTDTEGMRTLARAALRQTVMWAGVLVGLLIVFLFTLFINPVLSIFFAIAAAGVFFWQGRS